MTEKIAQSFAPEKATLTGPPVNGNGKDVSPPVNAFDDPEYARSRKWVLDIIPKTSLYASIDRYAGGVAMGIFGMIAGAIFNGMALSNPLLLGFIAIGVAVSVVGGYAHFQNRKISEPVFMVNREQGDIARAKLYGVHMAKAIEEHRAETPAVPERPIAQWRQTVLQDRQNPVSLQKS